jgi:hypothetical protein
MERAFARMDAGAVEADLTAPDPVRTARPKASPAPAPVPKPADATPAPAPAGDELEGEDAPAPAAKDAPAPPKPGDEDLSDAELKAPKPPQQAGPWKLKKYWEKRAAAVEQELAEARKRVAEADRNSDALKRAADIEKRNAELEEEIRYHNYAKSQEYADKYDKPYQEAWAAAANELAELDVLNEDGTASRKATPKDLLALANMPLGEARRDANAKFGDSADDVMAHRRRIIDLSRAQTKALEDARKAGAERTERSTATQQAIAQEVASLWTTTNADIAAKHEYLKPKEGDAEWNAKLTKATALADEAFSRNAADPSLTSEQRADLVRKHAAVRNRAIAYSALKLENNRLRAQIKERDDKLKAFEESAPNGGSANGASPAQPKPAATPMDRAFQRMDKVAVPGSPTFY